MTLTGLHLLLTYRCNLACDHCFVWSGPDAAGETMGMDGIEMILQQGRSLGTIAMIYFEGGEPFLARKTLLAGVARAHALGFRTGIVSNHYWATDVDAALRKLAPLVDAGLDALELSTDAFHGDGDVAARAEHAATAARQLGLAPVFLRVAGPGQARQSGAGVMYRGRAAVCLAADAPQKSWHTLTTCPFENLAHPGRVHVDPFGYVHLCQGIVLGNLFDRPLTELVAEYVPADHPAVGPLLERGPVGLVERYGLTPQRTYADACHLCYSARSQLRRRFPALLAPGQMYGSTSSSTGATGAMVH